MKFALAVIIASLLVGYVAASAVNMLHGAVATELTRAMANAGVAVPTHNKEKR